jgi:hypothetical protein
VVSTFCADALNEMKVAVTTIKINMDFLIFILFSFCFGL